MTNLNQPYTLGRWFVKPEHGERFIEEWKSFARWTSANQSGAGTAYLLQDPDHPHQFISFGAWDNLEAISAWRQRHEFKSFVNRAKSLCDDFQPHTWRLAATSKP